MLGGRFDLSIEESAAWCRTRTRQPCQVAISVVAALMWMIENPESGVVVGGRHAARLHPQDLQAVSRQVDLEAYDWTPLKHRDTTFAGYNDADLDRRIRGSSKTSS